MTSDTPPKRARPNPRREAFAVAKAQGATTLAAYVAAGYRPHPRCAARLAATEAVKRRIAVLAKEEEVLAEASPGRTLIELLRMANAKTSAACVREARTTLGDAMRLRTRMAERVAAHVAPARRKPLSDEEWLARFGPDALVEDDD